MTFCEHCRNLCDKTADCHCKMKRLCEKCMFKHNTKRKKMKLQFERGRQFYNEKDPNFEYKVVEAGVDRRGRPRIFVVKTDKKTGSFSKRF